MLILVVVMMVAEMVVIGGGGGGSAQGLGFPAKNGELKLMFKGHDFLPIRRGTN